MAKKRFPSPLLRALPALHERDTLPSGTAEAPRYPARGFHTDELMAKYFLNGALAYKVSRMFTWWLAALGEMPLPGPTILALRRCAYSWSALNDQQMLRCRLNICPWCRALKISEITKAIHRLNPAGVISREGLHDDRTKIFRRPRHTLCAIRDYHLRNTPEGQRILLNAVFFVSETGPHTQVLAHAAMRRLIHTTLDVDENWFVTPGGIETYLEITKDMQLYTGPRIQGTNTDPA